MAETGGIKALRIETRRKLLEARAEEVAKLERDIRERLILLIHIQVSRTMRYEYLEKRYGISARKWKNMFNRVQLPGIDMLASILKDHPEYATWLMLGYAVNSREVKSLPDYHSGLQIDPLSQLGIGPDVAQSIDPTIKGWEDKLDKALEQSIKEQAGALKNTPKSKKIS